MALPPAQALGLLARRTAPLLALLLACAAPRAPNEAPPAPSRFVVLESDRFT